MSLVGAIAVLLGSLLPAWRVDGPGVVVVGDSIVSGNTAIIEQHFRAAGTNVEIFAFPGSRIEDWLDHPTAWATARDADAIVVNLGTNHIGAGSFTPSDVLERTGSTPVVWVLPRNDHEPLASYLVTEHLRGAHADRIAGFVDWNSWAAANPETLPDGVHPDAHGAEVLAAMMVDAVRDVLSGGSAMSEELVRASAARWMAIG